MNLKTKRILALFVKLVLTTSVIHAQAVTDSSKKTLPYFRPSYNNNPVLKQQVFPNNLPGNFYARQLPFFCSKELKVQKAVGFPIKFRLSTVEYCDRLEGKRN